MASRFLRDNMEIINIVLQIVAIAGTISAFTGSILMYFIINKGKLGKKLLIIGFILMIAVIALSLVLNSTLG